MSPRGPDETSQQPQAGSARERLGQVSLADAVEGRCSVRRFLPEPVPRKDVEAMIALAVRAANAGNAQPWRFVAVEDERVRREMADAVHAALDALASHPECAGRAKDIRAVRAYATFFAEAPLVIAVFALPYASRSDELLTARGVTAEERDRVRQRPDLQSVGAAVQLLITAAHVMGYGSCWMTAPVLAAPAIEEILASPAEARLAAVVPVGRPAGRLHRSARLPLDDVLDWR